MVLDTDLTLDQIAKNQELRFNFLKSLIYRKEPDLIINETNYTILFYHLQQLIKHKLELLSNLPYG